MKKNYFEPSINVQAFEMENILTASGVDIKTTTAETVSIDNVPNNAEALSFKNFKVIF